MNSNSDLSGSLSFLNLGELLNLLGSNGSSGVLRINSSHTEQPGLVYLDKGNPINATNGSLSGIDAVFSLFGWTQGTFEFTEENVTCEKTITKSRMEIILDGLRLLDEGKIEKQGQTTTSEKQTESPVISGKLPLLGIKGPLVDYSYIVDEEGFYDGDEIVQEGNHGDWIWVILEGTAEIFKQTSDGPLKLLRIADGAFLGSVGTLLAGGKVRSATVKAVGNVQLGMLDSQLLANELANVSADFKNMIISIDYRLRQIIDMDCKSQRARCGFKGFYTGQKTAHQAGE